MNLSTKKKPLVLIIDDNSENLSVLSNLLGSENYKIALTKSATDALVFLESHLPDLILLDIMIPRMDGFEFFEKIKSRKYSSKIPVIFITGISNPDILVKGLAMGAVDYITKPYNEREVINRINTHLKLSEAAHYQNLTMRTGKIGLWQIDLKDQFIFIDPLIYELLELNDLDESKKNSFSFLFSLVHPSHRKSMRNLLELAIDGDILEYHFEHSIKGANNKYYQIMFSGSIHRNEQDEAIRIEGTFEDVSARHEYENLLADTIASVETIIENLPTGMVLLDKAFNIVKINHDASKMLKRFSSDFIKGTNITGFDFIIFPDGIFDRIKKEKFIQEEIIFQRSGLMWTLIQTSIQFILKNELYFLFTWVNISERVQIENELKKAKVDAEKAAKAKSVFLANMSHEIRTPLNAIVGMTDLALMSSDPQEQLDQLITVKDSANHLLQIVNDILDYSKIDSEKLEIDSISFNLLEVVENTIKTLQYPANEKGISLIFEPHLVMDVCYLGDPVRIRQVLTNLIGNAIKFTDKGHVKLTCVPTKPNSYSLKLDETALLFQVEDTGIGIPDDKQKEVFDSFKQLGGSRKTGGTGLGLAISKNLIELMNGDIYVQSNYGDGSIFSFYIVLKTDQKNLKKQKPEKKGVKPLKKESYRVLLAEDNAINVQLARVILEKSGNKVEVAENGLKALELLEKKQFDLILMDIEMPIMNGLEATSKIRGGSSGINKRDILIIALTAHAVADIKDRAIEAGVDGYITKPIDITRVMKTIEEIKIQAKK